MKRPIITLLTDFGDRDHYVASMKGVILGINPSCTLVDISHHVKPQDIQEGAFLLANAFSSFPKRTIHLAVVDPGVGGPRRPILVATSNYFFIGPDNGIFMLALQREEVKLVVHLNNERYFLPQVRPTFHGRDLFAPVAAHLSLGMKPESFGVEIEAWEELNVNRPEPKGKELAGEIIHIDTFGNLVSNIDEQTLFGFTKGRPFSVKVGRGSFPGLKRGYWEGKRGEVIALIGSGGFLEISVREGNAQKKLKVKKTGRVRVCIDR
jgi:S-adenosyl-L-methionine hydrolase (adenosine-forming)